MNDRERELWVLNDEHLYQLWQFWRWRGRNGKTIRQYVRIHREFLTSYINKKLGSKS